MNRVLSFMYHDVYYENTAESGFQNKEAIKYKITKNKFEEHLASLAVMMKTGCITKEQIKFTFDDGGISSYSIIAPLLQQYGFKGIFFISTKYINEPGFLTEDHIRNMHKNEHIIGIHSHSHPCRISKLPYEILKEEWVQSYKILSSILNGYSIIHASIPGGDYSEDVREILCELNIKHIYTSKPTNEIVIKNSQNIYGRYTIDKNITGKRIESYCTNKLLFKMEIKWYLLAFLKRVIGKKYHAIRKSILENIS